ncbi:hypothetical protein OG21DRAFT_1322292 [Imleria badia]|nr:hypothetical protein OG21DRAFT_1322292 [Imleria badia]
MGLVDRPVTNVYRVYWHVVFKIQLFTSISSTMSRMTMLSKLRFRSHSQPSESFMLAGPNLNIPARQPRAICPLTTHDGITITPTPPLVRSLSISSTSSSLQICSHHHPCLSFVCQPAARPSREPRARARVMVMVSPSMDFSTGWLRQSSTREVDACQARAPRPPSG